MSRNRQTSPVSEFDRRRAQDGRVVDDLRADIARRVNGRYLPTVLSRETLTNAIVVLEDSEHVKQMAAAMNYERLRYWVADLADIDYDPAGDRRYYPFRKAELQRLDYALADLGFEPDADIETEDPPRADEPAPTPTEVKS